MPPCIGKDVVKLLALLFIGVVFDNPCAEYSWKNQLSCDKRDNVECLVLEWTLVISSRESMTCSLHITCCPCFSCETNADAASEFPHSFTSSEGLWGASLGILLPEKLPNMAYCRGAYRVPRPLVIKPGGDHRTLHSSSQ